MFVSIEPLAFLVEEIAGGDAEVEVLVAPGLSPHTYEPTPRQMASLAEATILFLVGEPFESILVDKVVATHPHLTVVDLGEGLRTLHNPHHLDHHHSDHHHCHGHADPHIWVDPVLMSVMADRVLNTLVLALGSTPTHQKQIPHWQDRHQRLERELDELHKEIQEILAPVQGRIMVAYHGAFGYLAHRHGLIQLPVHMGSRGPSARDIARLRHLFAHGSASPVFHQPQYSRQTAQRLAEELGVLVVELDPLRRDYTENTRQMARQIAAGLAYPALNSSGPVPPESEPPR